jgi:membrane associated rhomboid family serine protease
VCKWLIGINLGVFFLQLITFESIIQPGAVTEWLLHDTQKVQEGQVWRLLTGAFLHSPTDWMHILFNMLFLWWFGSELETLYGSREFLAFYLVAAVFSSLAYQGWAMVEGPSLALGASGAITALLVLFAFHFPSRIIYLFFLVPVPIWLFVVFNVAQDTFIFARGIKTGVGVTAHLGGALFGAAYYHSPWRFTSLWDNFRRWQKHRARPGVRLYRPELELKETVAVAAPSYSGMDEHLEAKVDAVLEKVSRHGEASLTENEREILLRASEIYRKKRT